MLTEYMENTKPIKECTKEEIFKELLNFTKEQLTLRGEIENKKKMYYFSSEFLIGKLLINNLINLGIYDKINDELTEIGLQLTDFENFENEPSLGNGGLGRLASCFLDSVATLNLCGDGVGLNYHFGLFKQKFEKNMQKEYKNEWIENDSWLEKTDKKYTVKFKDFSLCSRMYDIKIIGYKGNCNRLHLFDVDTVDESIVIDGIEFDKSEIEKNLTLFLYPDDSDKEGKKLRIYQQYFMVSCGAQLIIEEALKKGSNLHNLKEYAVVQINDTHPTMIIPELIYQLRKNGINKTESIDIVASMCAYTNHTILSEALEKWPSSYLKEIVPHIYEIIVELDEYVKEKYNDESVYIIDENDTVHMAALDIHCTFSVNGVARLHTDILTNSELKNFAKIYPNKFNNKTNGITFRRWLVKANPRLTKLISHYIGDDFIVNYEKLADFGRYINDTHVLDMLLKIKAENKLELQEYILKNEKINLMPEGIYDVQIKRLHEYKRQQLNLLYVIDKYLKIKSGKIPHRPINFIFGAKAAPAYVLAKDIIHAILCIQSIINNDDEANKYIKIAMVENYNVTYAERIIPACDVSEQISLASKEASGTGNMKLMLNGAITLGTLDGANVEMAQYVGNDNIYIFGRKSDEVIEILSEKSYNPIDYYNKNKRMKSAVDFLVSDQMLKVGNRTNLENLYKNIKEKDNFMTLLDFEDYCDVKDKVFYDYENRLDWARKMLVNIVNARYFSSDASINNYNKEIWKL
ncbi:MAG: glycogen/starch/alpha-glucan phosphorylase [Ruminococcaceae bacterium]|nr:glycogen/starch/alpha-glucan phosphorylase [Oscillospiraceae bacterium]